MVSLDDPEKNAEFARSLGAELPVVSDPKGEAARAYGVLGLGGLYARRWTFYIDADGILREIDKDVSPATAGQDILRKLDELGFSKRAADRDRAKERVAE
jgi:peroxiredoxin Q/BCP